MSALDALSRHHVMWYQPRAGGTSNRLPEIVGLVSKLHIDLDPDHNRRHPSDLRMASASHLQLNMPGLFTPQSFRHGSDPRTDMFAPTLQFPIAGETPGRMINSDVHGTRKRTISTSQGSNADAWSNNVLEDSRYSTATSPPPLANDRYELARGGMERPDLFARQNADHDEYFQLQQQRGMWSAPMTPASTTTSKPWMFNQILNIVGGVAGKLVQFCSVPFRGFQAGGGQAYTFTAQGDITHKHQEEDSFTEKEAVQGPLPGEFPEDNYGVLSVESLDKEYHQEHHHERPRMAKRQRTGDNWIVVGTELDMESRPSTPGLSDRRVSTHKRSPSHIPRPASRTSMCSSTPKRPSLIPVSRRSTVERKAYQSPLSTSEKGHKRNRSYGRQSLGSPAVPKESNGSKKSPLPPGSQRIVNKMRREKLEDDARMRRMNSQMSAMLKEAREALGSRFEVEDYGGMDFEDEVDARR
ncbi:hypothetical protein BU24DRAFT_406065 [Aaosphaeria arxii CBS 175.79]|uniref:Uncharacterized protein n=1 Tax=Aaosphaeria arxii CBS 175.79 TaxID=1450172 RepID=A0A6A5Y2Y1_9PLEO|nr:uncharacterized protein BU24DRAFT_406065 [Aaosphaeria arxii CBS 175.79]KAF2019397.1 hypothetical protein BU24DRAFT_406065 [Aaosphaeria arxii CBS 175.79]